ncbi:MAG: protein DpdE [Solirubrobacteraceae bacterium]
MRSITRRELDDLIAHGTGVVLVDHHAAGRDRLSTLHAVTCRWARRVGYHTPLRFGESTSDALRWLCRTRGGENETWHRCPQCRGESSPDSEPTVANPRRDGETVWAMDRGRDLAYVVSRDPDGVGLAEFDAPGREAVLPRWVPTTQTAPYRPAAGEPCFIECDGEWLPAVLADAPVADPESLSVVSGGQVREVQPSMVRFRHLSPLSDPVAALTGPLTGEVRPFRVRHAFASSYAEFAAMSRGLTGVASAAVDLHPHQVGVARRVLADPVQRYLLADEVGLGKTIEAGFIIRQRLIDAPRSVILVLVPTALIWQWEDELESKFRLSEFRRVGIEVNTYENPRALRRPIVPDLLVIDEAHRIAAGCNSESTELARRYDAIRDLAHEVPRLLLLSATPVLHRERDFLAMLHLLDPDTYRVVDPAAFTARVQDRERIAELLLALSPGQPSFLVADSLPDLRKQFGEDAHMAQLLEELEQELDRDDDAAERIKSDARAHISETYRLHHRLLRNRRSVMASTDYVVRGRCGVRVVEATDPRSHAVDLWLERWRTTLLGDAVDSGGEEAIDRALAAFRIYASYASGEPEALVDVLNYRLQLRTVFRDSAGLSAEDTAALRAFEQSAIQRAVMQELIDELARDPDSDPKESPIAGALLSLDPGAYVVFTASPRTLFALAKRLTDAGSEVFLCTAVRGEDERRVAVTSFVESEGPRFLFCDATGEEGLNLQAADAVVHADLPWNISRIEQRIGRLDRYGTRGPVRSIVISSGPKDGYTHWWLSALTNSFHVFDQTTASTQYAIETVERSLIRLVLEDGPDDAEAALAEVERRIDQEQVRIDRIDSLDALARQETDDVAFVESFARSESELAARFADDVMAAIEINARPLGARVQQRENALWRLSLERESAALSSFTGINGRPIEVTTDRREAVKRKSLSLLRPGAPVVEALRIQLDSDPWLQTCAVWLPPQSDEDDLLAIRCDLQIEADASNAFAAWTNLEAARPRERSAKRTDADAPLVVAALKRRVDAYLPPTPTSLWLDRDGHPIDQPEVLAACNTGLHRGTQFGALTQAQRLDLARTFGGLSLEDVLAPITGSAERAVLDDTEGRRRVVEALARATRDWEQRDRILMLRQGRDGTASTQRDLIGEREVSRRLLAAIREPVAHWVGACLLVRSRTPPTGL